MQSVRASFPGLLTIHFVINCSMQNQDSGFQSVLIANINEQFMITIELHKCNIKLIFITLQEKWLDLKIISYLIMLEHCGCVCSQSTYYNTVICLDCLQINSPYSFMLTLHAARQYCYKAAGQGKAYEPGTVQQ